ncbi:class I SAM-dependent rRNA methyltransferase [Sandaracinus amylolyticus]|uniref:class I SAM-dependent rRNA methyltransferase n=1 Tax=Sandaracinus amylolyticus TaxID=927083 RepID=UPI001F0B32A7|nr:class I SAM-dependent rRNA methyltransferase [Sandaracinus amylolyticus]
MTTVTLSRGRVQPVWAGHPWVFAQAIARVDGAPSAGDVVDVVDPEGRFQGRGYWSPKSAIPVRIATRDANDPLDGASIGRAIERAAALRARFGLPSAETTGYRLVHSEGDGLPGLIVDVLGNVATVQLLTIGMKLREADVFAHVARVARVKTVIEVASEKAAQREGFEAKTGVVRGPDPHALELRERGLDVSLEPTITQKTGFYFDQRENRAMVERLARGARVLDLYSFVGAFAMFAARGGAQSVIAVDSSPVAIATASRLAHHHGMSDRITFERADARHRMEELARKKERFDLVVLDPPKLAPTVKHLERARGAYRRLNADAARVTERDGVLVSCSCSAAMTPDELVRVATMGARDAGRDLTLLHMGEQGPDHPVPAAFAEGRYLKAAFFRVT